MVDYLKDSSLNKNQSINNEKKNEEEKEIFEKEKLGFKMYSFNYKEINELHKKKFLHQNNAIEIFLKNGKNFYLAFNVDQRDTIVGKIIQNIIEEENFRKRNLMIDNINSNNSKELIFNKEISNGNINNTNITSNINNNDTNNFTFEIVNNTASMIKNENMIFIRDANLFIEKEKNQNKILKNIIFKGKKNYCRLVDTKEILEQATEKWSNGFVNTYSYIMILNTLSGRTYNNLAQYPIYPWILKDYSSNEIDLNDL